MIGQPVKSSDLPQSVEDPFNESELISLPVKL